MKAISYSPGVTREIATILTADPGAATTLDERTLVAADGYWQPGDWRTDLARALSAGHPLSAVGFRLEPAEQPLKSRDWATIARRLLTQGGWQHAPWIAVRTGSQSMVVVAASGNRLRPAELVTFAKVVSREFGQTEPRTDNPQPRPMRILDAGHTAQGRLAVLVDRKPDVTDLRFTPHLVHDELPTTRHPAPHTLYLGQHPDGYVLALLDSGDGRGSNNEPFDLHLADGTTRTIVGPYNSGNAAQVARHLPDIHLGQVFLHDDPRQFRDNPNGGTAAILTNPAAQRALFKAARHITDSHPPAVAQTSYPPGQPTTATPVENTPPDPTRARRSTR